MKKLLIIDGNAIVHRAFHALPLFKTSDDFPTNAIYGFFSMLNRVLNDYKPDYLSVAFDRPEPTFRKKLFKEYQAHRPKIKDELKIQIPVLKEGIKQAGIYQIEIPGYEADDIIGSLAKKLKSQISVLILSGDKDILQLCDENVYILSPKTGVTTLKIYNPEEVKKRFGLPPKLIPDLKALAGDPSDNYHGAKGIGPKTAAKLLQEYSSVENLYANLEKISDQRIREILKQNKENVLLSKKLATIKTDLELELNLDQLRFEKVDPKLKEFFEKYEIRSLIKRFFAEKPEEKPEKKKTEPQQNTLF